MENTRTTDDACMEIGEHRIPLAHHLVLRIAHIGDSTGPQVVLDLAAQLRLPDRHISCHNGNGAEAGWRHREDLALSHWDR